MVSMNRLTKDERVRVISALVEGNSIQATVRITGIARNSVAKLLCDIGKVCEESHDEVLQSKEVGLQIEDFGKDKKLHRRIRDYWTLLSDHRSKLKMPGVIHTKGWYRHFGW